MASTPDKKSPLTEREQLIIKAKLAEQAERYDEMAACMKKAVEKNNDLTLDERNLLSVAYKNAVGARRASWRIISCLENKNNDKRPGKSEIVNEYKKQIEEELKSICHEILEKLDHLLENENVASHAESKVFYLKMKGDYYRYISEFNPKDSESVDASEKAYKEASEIAAKQLIPTHPIRLGLALNYSVFFYEIKNCPKVACMIAQEAFDRAIAELDRVSEESYKDCTLIMQLLRDNLGLWTTGECDQEAGGKEQSSQGGDEEKKE